MDRARGMDLAAVIGDGGFFSQVSSNPFFTGVSCNFQIS